MITLVAITEMCGLWSIASVALPPRGRLDVIDAAQTVATSRNEVKFGFETNAYLQDWTYGARISRTRARIALTRAELR